MDNVLRLCYWDTESPFQSQMEVQTLELYEQYLVLAMNISNLQVLKERDLLLHVFFLQMTIQMMPS